jgi:hypothetical protein
MSTIKDVIHDLDGYLRNWQIRREIIPIHIRNNILYQINVTGSIDTGRFLRAVDFREEALAGGYRFLIDSARDSEVTYDDIVERGRKDGANYQGRFPYRRGIEATNIQTDTDYIAEISFAR